MLCVLCAYVLQKKLQLDRLNFSFVTLIKK
jgi:hypothetical protein